MERLNIKGFFSALGILFTGYEKAHKQSDNIIFLLSCLFTIIVSVFIFTKKKNHLFYLLILWSFLAFFLAIIISFFIPIFVPRYLIFAPIGFCLLIFYMMEHGGKRFRLFMILAIFIITFSYTAFEVVYKRKGDVRKTINEIKKLANKNDYLFVSDKYSASYFVAAYYFDENRVYIYKESSNTIPYFIGLAIIPKNKITTKLPHYPKKAFILDDDTKYRILTAL
jgi:hypothetical protein